ncbi:MAG: hypothetical protein H6R18_148 [Proteobacteria bacterium]|nr:hypothetical protein [Pseudomonadota bacterium]
MNKPSEQSTKTDSPKTDPKPVIQDSPKEVIKEPSKSDPQKDAKSATVAK